LDGAPYGSGHDPSGQLPANNGEGFAEAARALKASGLRGNGGFFNIVWKLFLEIEVPYLLAIGKFIGAQMSEIVAHREQRSVESHARIAPSFYPYFDSEDRFRTFGIAID
jgi:hypothetical protein